MWHDICSANRDSLLSVLHQFTGDLAKLTNAIEKSDSTAIMNLFQRAKHARDNLYLE
jgi:prephenate dehydrogenase